MFQILGLKPDRSPKVTYWESYHNTMINLFDTETKIAHKAQTLRHALAGLGPGILMAAAAVGGSHLAASTQAGATFGWQLAGLIVLVNVLKYPFFRAGPQFTIISGKSLLEGYLHQGRFYLQLYTVINAIAAIPTTAGGAMLTAAILTLFISLSINAVIIIVFIVSLAVLIIGHYSLLDCIAKYLMLAMVIFTCVAVALAFDQSVPMDPTTITPSPWQLAHIGFLVALMGWMPVPIEASTWNSLWLLEKQKLTLVNKRQALFDFNIGYFFIGILALLFLALGALVMHSSGETFASNGTVFASQLVNMYTQTMGSHARWLIGGTAFLCMFSTTLTALDGYSRTLGQSITLLQQKKNSSVIKARTNGEQLQTKLMVLISVLALVLIFFFNGALLTLLQLVMTLSFLTTIIFAWLNFRLMTSEQLQAADQFGMPMKILSWMGLSYMLIFAALFLYWFSFI